jgi:two-component system, NarL family, invasion response regulator UvrY
MPMSPKVLLADDHSMIRKAVRILCQVQMGLAEIGEAASCKELTLQLEKKGYTHLVLDLNLSDGSSLDILPDIRNAYPDLKIAVLTVQADNIYHDLLRKYGIDYFINKTADADDTVLQLGRFFRNERPGRCRAAGAESRNPFSHIAPRELQVLQYWLRGTGTKETARLLGVTMSTISTVKGKILEKTNTGNFVQLSELAKLYKIG